MDYEDFERLYEDELDAITAMEDEFFQPPKGKRSLNFSTPTTKCPKPKKPTEDSEEDSFSIQPLSMSFGEDEENVEPAVSSQRHNESQESAASRKRKATGGKADPGAETASEELPGSNSDRPDAPWSRPSKKPKSTEDAYDEFMDGTGPESPGLLIQEEDLVRHTKRTQSGHITEGGRILSRIPRGDFLPVTGSLGERFYLPLKKEEDLELEIELQFVHDSQTSSLLNAPIAALRVQLEEERLQKADVRSEELARRLTRSNPTPMDDDISVVEDEINLWVQKYCPRAYTDLLSDEATNRTLLKWLKLWDYVVFGKDVRVLKAAEKIKASKKKEPKGFNKNILQVLEELDQHHRPVHKISLLCGPPGLGKTTLAHVVARHAGYNVVEMNASDDRTAEIFRQKIESSTQMKAVLGVEKKPNCLIIDEIDGAPQAAINILLNLIKSTPEPATNQPNKKHKKQQMLMRPIICICNDIYVPALKQLRQQAFVVHFPPTVSAKLASRLYEITRLENFTADMSGLLALAEKSQNDIRSCLNTLQFIRRQCDELTTTLIHTMSVGQKDENKSIFDVWKFVFTMPRAAKSTYINPHQANDPKSSVLPINLVPTTNPTSLAARFENSLNLAQSVGDYEKVVQGLQENYLSAKTKDTRLASVVYGSEWLVFYDLMTKEMQHTQNYSYYKFLPFVIVSFHLLFASNVHLKLQYPSPFFEFLTKHQRSLHLIDTLLADVSPTVRKSLTATSAAIELLAPLTEIIQPTLRPVNTHLYSTREKDDLAHLVRVMIAYNLCYRQERTVEGQYIYVLDPNLDEIVQYPDIKPKRQLTYAAKQLISHEVKVEKMRRGDAKKMEEKKAETPIVSSPKPDESLPNYKRQNLTPVALPKEPKAEKPVKDFFGRRVVKKVTTNTADAAQQKQEQIGGEIWFAFKEGFSNAVRRTVRVQDFL